VNVDTGLWERHTDAIELLGTEKIVSANFEVKESQAVSIQFLIYDERLSTDPDFK
jgi:hypothetical protein